MIYIIAAILIFGVLIAVHELGHFLAAKACGVRVNEFSIGMGPTILHRTKGDTTYSLRLLPIGGFCAMEGEEEDSNDPTALNNQKLLEKTHHFCRRGLYELSDGPDHHRRPIRRGQGDSTSRSSRTLPTAVPSRARAACQVGDRLVSIDGERVYVYSDVSLLLGRNKTGVFDLKVKRDGQTVTLKDFPMERAEYTDQQGQTYTGFGLMFGAEEATVGSRLRYSWNNAVDFVRIVRLSLQMLVTGEAGLKDVSGPVGIVSTITDVGEQAESASAAVENIAYLAALLAVNLAVMNLLPLPALDGGKIFFLVVNALCMLTIRKKIPEKFEAYVHLAGFALLMLLMLVITFQDVWKLFR